MFSGRFDQKQILKSEKGIAEMNLPCLLQQRNIRWMDLIGFIPAESEPFQPHPHDVGRS